MAYQSLSHILDAETFTAEDNSIDYEKLYAQFPLPPFKPHERQSVPLANTFVPNKYSSIYRSGKSPQALISTVTPELRTLHDLFEKAVELHPDYDCVGTRLKNSETGELDAEYSFLTYKQVQAKRDKIGSAIKNLVGRPAGENYVVSIFSSNRAEWVISSLAIQAFGLTSTALYDTLGPHTSRYILNLTESPLLITSYDKLLKIINLKKSGDGLPFLRFLVSMDDLDFNKDLGLSTLAAEAGIKLLDFKHLERLGELSPVELEKPHEALCISFTSGTTGNPKGVIVSQEMAVSGIVCCFTHIEKPKRFLKSGEQFRYYSFLPLAHIYELQDIYLALSSNYKIYFPFDPSPLKLLDHLKLIKPHYVCLVPRVYTKFESALKQGFTQSFTGREVISKAVKAKQADPNSSSFLLDSFFSPKIRSKLGFEFVDFCVSGSAPISKETVHFLKASLNVGFKQGYGLTESFAGISVSQLGESDITSGPIGVSTEMRLREVPEMNYYVTDKTTGQELEEPQGELYLRGPQVFKGYYKNEEATKDSFDEGGWFKTGDIAQIDKFGRITIVDRVKNFFKLAQGEYVTPERIENIYLSSCASVLAQCFVHGDSLQTYLVGILGVDIDNLRSLLKSKFHQEVNSISNDELLEKVNSSPDIKRFLLQTLNELIKKDGLQGFEKLHNFKVKIDPLKLEDELVTPTFKIKRLNASKFYKADLEELYSEGSLMKSSNL